MADCCRTSRKLVRLGVLLLLLLAMSGCRTGVRTATISPTATIFPTPISRPILTPLPTVGISPSTTPICTPLGIASSEPYPGRVGQVWYAEQIVVGTVIAQETRWDGDRTYQAIDTYSLFRVEERVRGIPLDEILISQRAGTIDGCTQTGSNRQLSRDQRLLLFLGFSDRQAPALYYVMFGDNGIYTGAAIDQIVAETRQILSQPLPATLSNYWTIPLNRAPLVPSRTATPQP